MPPGLLRETAYHEQLGLDRSLVSVYAAIEHVLRRLQDKAQRVQEAEQLHGLQQQLVDIERQHKQDGVWGGSLKDGQIPAGQARLNGLMEQAHALAAEIIQRVPDHRDTPPQTPA